MVIDGCQGQRFAALHATQQKDNKPSEQPAATAAAAEPKPVGTPNNNHYTTTCPACGAVSVHVNTTATSSATSQVTDSTSPSTKTSPVDNPPQPPTPFGGDASLADINDFFNLDSENIGTIGPFVEGPTSMVCSPFLRNTSMSERIRTSTNK